MSQPEQQFGFIDQIKSIVDNPPWPDYVAVCQSRYDEVKAAIPPFISTRQEFCAPWGLKICVDDAVPEDEIRLVNLVRKNVDGALQLLDCLAQLSHKY